MKSLPRDRVDNIMSMLHEGKPLSEIAETLHISPSTLQRVCRGMVKIIPPPKISRPSLVSPDTKRAIACNIDTGKSLTIKHVQQYIQETEGVH
ncbi:hypothetical protein BGX20_005563, partial [Mortierella sp. AD010]